MCMLCNIQGLYGDSLGKCPKRLYEGGGQIFKAKLDSLTFLLRFFLLFLLCGGVSTFLWHRSLLFLTCFGATTSCRAAVACHAASAIRTYIYKWLCRFTHGGGGFL